MKLWLPWWDLVARLRPAFGRTRTFLWFAAAKSNAVACEPAAAPPKRGRGRPRLYGPKRRLKDLFDDASAFTEAASPVYGEQGVKLRYRSVDLCWRPAGCLVRFVLVIHPLRGSKILERLDLDRAEGLRLAS